MMKWIFKTLTLIMAFFSVSANSATTHINYDLSGGAAFLTASGTAAVTVYGSVAGVPFTRIVTGTASGATSWNFVGDLDVVVDYIGAITTTPNLFATRRAGVINIDLPLFDLGGLVDISLDATLASNSSTMVLANESGTLVNSTDWAIDQLYGLSTGILFSASVASVASTHIEYDVPLGLQLSNQAGQSLAELVAPHGTTSGEFLSGLYNSGCQVQTILGCLATIESVHYDLSGVNLSLTSSSGNGFSLTLLPTVVPIPTALWLFGSGLIGLIGIARRKKA